MYVCVCHLFHRITVTRNFSNCFVQDLSDAHVLSYPSIHSVVRDTARNTDRQTGDCISQNLRWMGQCKSPTLS